MTLNTLFKLVRELQGKDQTVLARAIGLKTSSAISKFEKGEKSPLSEETLKKLASLLQMNPDYITGASLNPFSSPELVKMYLPEEDIGIKVLFTPIKIIAEANQRIEIVTLLPARKFEFMEKIETGTILEPGTYAIAIKDQDGNMFLFRRKSPSAYIMADRSMLAQLEEISDHKDKDIRHRTRKLKRDLFEKIRNWNVLREDIEPFFSNRKLIEVTATEERLLHMVRKKKKDPEKVIELLDKIE